MRPSIRESIGEDRGLAEHRLVFRPREAHAVVRPRRAPALDGEEPVQIGHAIDAEYQDVEEREDGGHEPQSQRDGADNGQRRERGAVKRAERVEHVADGRIDEGRAARVAALVGDERRRAEAGARPDARLRGAQTVRDVLRGLALDVEGELFVELALHAPRRQQRAHAKAQVAEIHRQASFITRPMAVVMRSHSLASTASCLRPAAVSW
jgi:hypothetical protein